MPVYFSFNDAPRTTVEQTAEVNEAYVNDGSGFPNGSRGSDTVDDFLFKDLGGSQQTDTAALFDPGALNQNTMGSVAMPPAPTPNTAITHDDTLYIEHLTLFDYGPC